MRTSNILRNISSSNNGESIRQFLDGLGKNLGFQKLEDFYHLRRQDFPPDSISLVSSHGSIPHLLQNAYPEHSWNAWQFLGKTMWEYWDNKENEKDYVEWLGKQLNFRDMKDWYRITRKDIMDKGGDSLLLKYDSSPPKLLITIYPNHEWKMWKFGMVPIGYWETWKNQRDFVDWLGKQLGFERFEEWYRITKRDIEDHGGSTLLHKYGGSPSKLVRFVIPEHNWKVWRFETVARGTWTHLEISERIDLIHWLSTELKISSIEDWYRISWLQIREKISLDIIKRYSLVQLLKEGFPDYNWDMARLNKKYLGKTT